MAFQKLFVPFLVLQWCVPHISSLDESIFTSIPAVDTANGYAKNGIDSAMETVQQDIQPAVEKM